MIKIILADDHSIVRNGIRHLLEKENDILIAGEALDGGEALAMAKLVQPDIILADINMPVINGIVLVETLMIEKNPPKIMLLTMHDNQAFMISAFRAGAAAYLFKNIGAAELLFAIKQVYAGRRYLSTDLSLRLLDRFLTLPAGLGNLNGPVELSDRELDILKLIAEGYTNQGIADKLYTSKRTVEGHRQAMIERTGVSNTAALIRFAMQHGLLK